MIVQQADSWPGALGARGTSGHSVDRTEWGMTPPTVGAYYDPQMNDVKKENKNCMQIYRQLNASAGPPGIVLARSTSFCWSKPALLEAKYVVS